MSSIIMATGRLYALLLLQIAILLHERHCLSAHHYLVLALLNSPISGENLTRQFLKRLLKNRGFLSTSTERKQNLNKSKQHLTLRGLPSDIRAAVLISLNSLDSSDSSQQGVRSATGQGLSSDLRCLLIVGSVMTSNRTSLPALTRNLRTFFETSTISKIEAELSILAFYAVLIRIKSESKSSPSNTLLLLQTLEDVAIDKVCALHVRNFFASLATANCATLSSAGLTFLSRLYLRHDRLVLPVLLRLMNRNLCSQLAVPDAFACALAVRDIVKHSPALHGIDAVPCLNHLLGLKSFEMAGVVALALQSVEILIVNGVLSAKSFFSIFSARYANDPRQSVSAAYFHLIGNLASSEEFSEEEGMLQQKLLWSTFFEDVSRSNHSRAACLEALSKFSILVSQSLPESLNLQDTTALRRANAESRHLNDTPISPLFYIETLLPFCANGGPSLMKSFTNFMKHRFWIETKHLPRSATVLKRLSLTEPNDEVQERNEPSLQVLAQIPRLQQSFFYQNDALRPFVAAGLVMTYNPPSDLGRKEALVRRANSFRTMISSLLDATPLFSDMEHDGCFLTLACTQQWHLLVYRAFIALVEGRRADKENDKDAQAVVSIWARDIIAAAASQAASPNAVIALCALVAIVNDYDRQLMIKDRMQMDKAGKGRLDRLTDGVSVQYISHAEWVNRASSSLLQLATKKLIEDVHFADLLARFTRSASSAEKTSASVFFSMHELFPALHSLSLLESAIDAFRKVRLEYNPSTHEAAGQRPVATVGGSGAGVNRVSLDLLRAIGGALFIQRLVVSGLLNSSTNLKSGCHDIIRLFDGYALHPVTNGAGGSPVEVNSSSYLVGLTLSLSALCCIREFQGITKTTCARLIQLLRASASSTSGDTALYEQLSTARASADQIERHLDVTALCCALLIANSRRFVLTSESSTSIVAANRQDSKCSDILVLRDLANLLSRARSERPCSGGVAAALGFTLIEFARHQAQQAPHESPSQEARNASDLKQGKDLVQAMLHKVWLPVIADNHGSPEHKMAAVKGVATLTGAFDHLLDFHRQVVTLGSGVSASAAPAAASMSTASAVLEADVSSSLVSSMVRDLNDSRGQPPVLRAHHAWALGLLHQRMSLLLNAATQQMLAPALGALPTGETMRFPTRPRLDRNTSLIATVIAAVIEEPSDCTKLAVLLAAFCQRFDAALPCFAWIQLGSHLKNTYLDPRQNLGSAGASDDIVKPIVTLAVENAHLTPSLRPLLESFLEPHTFISLGEWAQNYLLDRPCEILELCSTTRVNEFLNVFRDRRLCCDDVLVAEKSWKLFSEYLERNSSALTSDKGSAASTVVSLIQETTWRSLALTKARYFVTACLVSFRDSSLHDLLLTSLQEGTGDVSNSPCGISNSKNLFRRALELRLATTGLLATNAIENPFQVVETLDDQSWAHFIKECILVSYPASVIENSTKWLLEVLPSSSLTQRSVTLLSVLAFMMTTCEKMDAFDITRFKWEDYQLLYLLPHHLDQLVESRVWGEVSIRKILEWLIATLENVDPVSFVYLILHETLLTLRNKQAFKSGLLWARAALLPLP